MLFFAAAALGLSLPSLVGAISPSFSVQNDAYDSGLFTPMEDLNLLSYSEFATLSHPAFPNYSVRIKKTDFCDGTVAAHTGYIDIEARHLFFYFFESRSDPDIDDVIFWTNGGPGASSMLGLFMELGPCRITDDRGPVFHKESWNSNANIFFVDQPIGVGFSYADYGETVGTTEEAAKDIASFVAIFFEHFTKFKGRGFHMSGESYGGRYLPLFASAVYDQNAYLIDAGLTPVNLSSIMIGNGLTEFATMTLSYYEMTCTFASVPPVLDISTCVRMKQVLPRCQKWMKESCIDQFDDINCAAAANFCSDELFGPFSSTNKNPYDISVDCDGPIEETLCYPVTNNISAYLDHPSVRTKLGVDPHFDGQNFSSVSWEVNSAFVTTMDEYHQTQLYIAALLERKVRVLVYVGSYDFICNWVGNNAWTLVLDWSGKETFVNEELREWFIGGKKAGLTRSSKGLTFATIEGAGHMVPYDKPQESLELVNRWLKGQAL
ncbi:serine carboxypeptidase [Guyanagaster necrorhizus]|uniref:Carboxypeptidase n=1 Tax=Guyanagaster necrorhizus TaxID=856835 RepID=A0A9P7VUK7_9AGAR|nr:serine carboxypeptidase [Guyanagaster necrorhizus MCA 3950]KAG7446141.1 serine carboxypeptidase [Guyanagaster necrorhizus MCA 3950]